jgi:undecaprenyl-diphosphatase
MHEIIIIVARYFVFIPVIAIVYLFFLAKKPVRIRLVVFLAIASVLTAVLVKIADTIHSDPRPFISDGVKPYFSSATDNGFPSDHTVFSALLAFTALTVSKKWGVALFILAALIGSARVIAGVHHAQDVIGGLAVAAISYEITSIIVRLVHKKS